MPTGWSGPGPRGLSASRPMSARSFREQLDLLATEYGILEEENHHFRVRLTEEPAACEQSTVAPIHNLVLMLPTQVPVDFEFQNVRRLLAQDGIHSALPEEQQEEGIEVERLGMPTGTSAMFAVPPPDRKPLSAQLTSPAEHPPSLGMLRESAEMHLAAMGQTQDTMDAQPSAPRSSTTIYNRLKRATTARSSLKKQKRGVTFASAEDTRMAKEHVDTDPVARFASKQTKTRGVTFANAECMEMVRESVATEQAWEGLDTDATGPSSRSSTTIYGKLRATIAPRLPTSLHRKTRAPVFANAQDMKDRVRAQLTKETYNVTDSYKRQGVAQFIARSSTFETLSIFVISLNAMWIWIDTDYNTKEFLTDAHPIFLVAENFFCFYFFFEISIRFCAFKNKWDGLKDAWFVFDSFLVFVMVLETWVMTIVILALSSQGQSSTNIGDASILRITRLLRIMRTARVARLLRAMPELVILIKGLVAAAKSVCFTLLLLVVIMYVYAIALTQMLRNTDPGEAFFDSVPKSMHTLWVRATLLDEVWEVMDAVGEESVAYIVILDLFILLAPLTVMNMLVGVLCEVVSAVAASEREEMNLKYVKSKIQRIFFEFAHEEDQEDHLWANISISKDEFVQLLDNQEACQTIQELGVDVVGLVDYAEGFFAADDTHQSNTKELSIAEFMEAIVSLRVSNFATVKDIIDLRQLILESISKHEKAVKSAGTASAGGLNCFPNGLEARSSLNVHPILQEPDNSGFNKRLLPGSNARLRSANANGGPSTPVAISSISEFHQDVKLRSAAGSSAVLINTPNIAEAPEEPEDAIGQVGKMFSRPKTWDGGHA